MSLILSPHEDYSTRTGRIQLQTSKGNVIDNYQVFTLENFERSQFNLYDQSKYPLVRFRTDPCPIYNCHGLSFASKRTCIDKALEINKILKDDRYVLMQPDNVLPGDLVLYIDEASGDIPHSGYVVRVEAGMGLVRPIFVLSKWGKYKEAVHHVDDCPYYNCTKDYFRVNYQEYA